MRFCGKRGSKREENLSWGGRNEESLKVNKKGED